VSLIRVKDHLVLPTHIGTWLVKVEVHSVGEWLLVNYQHEFIGCVGLTDLVLNGIDIALLCQVLMDVETVHEDLGVGLLELERVAHFRGVQLEGLEAEVGVVLGGLFEELDVVKMGKELVLLVEYELSFDLVQSERGQDAQFFGGQVLNYACDMSIKYHCLLMLEQLSVLTDHKLQQTLFIHLD